MSLAVVDASVTFSWCFVDQASEATDRLLDLVVEHGALVPGLWFLEVGNGLVQAERRRKITAADADARLELISALPIIVDQNTVGRAWNEVLGLARTERLSVYDATYLELALRRGLPLYTRDNALAEAARRQGIAVSPG
jgi:predicted nucleic acid-binding protein